MHLIKLPLRLLVIVSLALWSCQFALAQVTPPDLPDLPVGDPGWCTVANFINPDNSVGVQCGFGSPHDACAYQRDRYNPDKPLLPTGAVTINSLGKSVAGCDWKFGGVYGFGVRPTNVNKQCPAGSKDIAGRCIELTRVYRSEKSCSVNPEVGNPVSANPEVGNPVSVMTGTKTDSFLDYQTPDGRFKLERYYYGQRYSAADNRFSESAMGFHWRLSAHYDLEIQFRFNTPDVYLQLPSGADVKYEINRFGAVNELSARLGWQHSGYELSYEGDYLNPGDFIGTNRKIFLTHKSGKRLEFILVKNTPDAPYFERGLLTKVTEPGGYTQIYAYDALNDLTSISDNFGRSMQFTYKTTNYAQANFGPEGEQLTDSQDVLLDERRTVVESVTLPDGSIMNYDYDSADTFSNKWGRFDRLKKVTRTDAAGALLMEHTLHHENALFPNSLTGITDTDGVRMGTYTYDEAGRAIETKGAENSQTYALEYGDVVNFERVHTVTNPLGKTTRYNISTPDSFSQSSKLRIDSVVGEATANCPQDVSELGYSSILGVTGMVDKEGRATEYERDDLGRVTSKTRAAGTDVSFTETATYDEQTGLPLTVVSPGLTTNYTYDGIGRLVTMAQVDTSNNPAAPRIWTYTYEGVGPNVASIDGPLPGASDTQTFTYDGANLLSATNEVGHVTSYFDYTAHGLPRTIRTPNNVNTALEYDTKNRLTRITTDPNGAQPADTQITYDAVDNITTINPPSGATVTMAYDDARRLTSMTNAVGETVEYTYDAMDNITSTTMKGADGSEDFALSRVMDEMGRVIKTIGAGGALGTNAQTQIAYDKMDNPVTITDPRQQTWQTSFDSLNRVISQTEPTGATTTFDLAAQNDGREDLNAVTDARNLTTNYVRNGFGEIIREVNFQIGTTQYTRDERGLVTSMTDGRGQVVNYTYDAAGRPLTTTYVGAPEDNVTYAYDEGGAAQVGNLTTITEGFGETSYTYNALGFATTEARQIGDQIYITQYGYNPAGDILSVTYPTGRVVSYARDAAARVVTVSTEDFATDVTINLIDNITYAAYGPMTGGVFADGHQLSIDYDTGFKARSLRRTRAGSDLMNIGFAYDNAGDITALNDTVRPMRSQSFTYDSVSRVTSASGGYGQIDYGYDLGGDRLSRTITAPDAADNVSETYAYDPQSLQLTQVLSQTSTLRAFEYAPSGQVISDTRAGTPYVYGLNARGRMTSVTRGGAAVATYTYDDYEQRIGKTLADGTSIHYHYDDQGRLISETDAATGALIRDYIWLGLTPIASYGATDEAPPVPANCDLDRLGQFTARAADLTTRITNQQAALATRQTTLSERQTRLSDLQVRLIEREARAAELSASIADKDVRLADLNAKLAATDPSNFDRIELLTTRINTLSAARATQAERLTAVNAAIENITTSVQTVTAAITTIDAAITTLETRIPELQATLSKVQTRLAGEQADCEGVDVNAGVGTGTPQFTLLHADHLGRPAFATNLDGTIVWDGGITTPFGQQISTMGAFTQTLMFPGQYADAESGLSHNWHRTYDPTLGRYLQSDPIGLAGGLNRYVYTAGNPVNMIDPDGLSPVCRGPSPLAPPMRRPSSSRAGCVGTSAAVGGAIGGILGAAVSTPCIAGGPAIAACGAAAIPNGALAGATAGTAIGQLICNDDDIAPAPVPVPMITPWDDMADNDNNSEDDCKKIKKSCIEGCSEFVLGKPRGRRVGLAGDDFFMCVKQCMERNGC